jgi:hypothetical protein
VNVAGWVGALAVLRGYAHAKLPVSAGTLGTVFAVGVPCLAIAALAGGMIAEPHRARFLADATVAVVIFAGSVVVALAIARLTAVGAGSGFDWRRNPTWVALLVVLVLTTLAVAVPSSIASPLIALIAGSAVGPLLVIGLGAGLQQAGSPEHRDRRRRLVLLFGLIRLLTGFGTPLKISLGGATGGEPATTDPGPVVQVGLLGRRHRRDDPRPRPRPALVAPRRADDGRPRRGPADRSWRRERPPAAALAAGAWGCDPGRSRATPSPRISACSATSRHGRRSGATRPRHPRRTPRASGPQARPTCRSTFSRPTTRCPVRRRRAVERGAAAGDRTVAAAPAKPGFGDAAAVVEAPGG